MRNHCDLRPILALACALAIAVGLRAEEKKSPSIVPPFDQLSTISVKGHHSGISLQSLCVSEKGEVVALVAPQKGYSNSQKGVISEVHVLTPEGKELKTWDVSFHANSINIAPDGTVYVAGDGKVARFDRDGKELLKVELPHIAKLLEDKAGMKKKAEAQLKQQKDQMKQMLKTYEDMKKKIEDKKAEDRTKLETRQLEQYTQILEMYKENSKYTNSMTVDSIVEQITSRLRIINAIAVSEKDVFIVCGESEGYGFAVWRMNHDFSEPKQVRSNVIGCCGQMDVQCCGSDIYLAENTRHQFAKYDRDGKELGSWGKTGMMPLNQPPTRTGGANGTDPGFGGCCNPMNLRCSANGDVYTAESEGIIKRFSPKGDFLGIVGQTNLTGGCKCVAVSVAPEGDRLYLCDVPHSQIVVFGTKAEKKAEPGQK